MEQSHEAEATRRSGKVLVVEDIEGKQDNVDSIGIIDWDYVTEKLGDEEIIRDIMPTYFNDIQKHFDILSKAVETGDSAAIASHAHAIKGVGRNLGVERLFDMASQMECAGRENDMEASTRLFKGLKIEYEKVLMALSQSRWIEKAKTA